MAVAMQMIAGGGILLVVGLLTGEWGRLDVGAISIASVWATLYLVVFGSVVAINAYIWLLRVSTPAAVSTYAFVNPVVAVALGWWLAGETLTGQTVVASVLIVGSVVLMLATKPRNGSVTPPATTRQLAVEEREVQAA